MFAMSLGRLNGYLALLVLVKLVFLVLLKTFLLPYYTSPINLHPSIPHGLSSNVGIQQQQQRLVMASFEPSVHYQIDDSNSYPNSEEEAGANLDIDSEAAQQWAALTPYNGVFHLSQNNSSDSSARGKAYTMTMFHQLRCLAIIREQMAVVKNVGSKPSSPSSTRSVQHCLNYLRQMVLCHANTSLELLTGGRGAGEEPTVAHSEYQCKDWEVLYRELEMKQ